MPRDASARRRTGAADRREEAGYVSHGGDTAPAGARRAMPAGAATPEADGASYLTAEISASAVRHNLRLIRDHVGTGVLICAVVKADAYGHGLDALLPVIAHEADWLAVATPAEALELRRRGYDGATLVFFSPGAEQQPPAPRAALRELIASGVTLTVTHPGEVPAISSAADAAGRPADVHLKIDTGMGRGGVPLDGAPALAEAVRHAEGVRLTGLYTHFATADEADKGFAREQFDRFVFAADACGETKGLLLHAANSAATIDLPETHLDMVRPGIAVYGYQPSDQMQRRLPLRPALRLTGPLMQVKSVPAGSGCGYGLAYTFDRPSRLGLVPAGYADGYLRSLSNAAVVRVRGCHAPVRGRVSMDQTIIDLTDIPEARPGDEVEIISADPAEAHSVEGLARLAGTIPYEVTCRLGRRVHRVLVP